MKKSVIAFFLILTTMNYGFAQQGSDLDQPGSTHEKWEYVLEDSGDILQLALPISAGRLKEKKLLEKCLRLNLAQ